MVSVIGYDAAGQSAFADTKGKLADRPSLPSPFTITSVRATVSACTAALRGSQRCAAAGVTQATQRTQSHDAMQCLCKVASSHQGSHQPNDYTQEEAPKRGDGATVRVRSVPLER